MQQKGVVGDFNKKYETSNVNIFISPSEWQLEKKTKQ
jgi:hypothetical protein